MSELSGFVMFDTEAKATAERRAKEAKATAERRAKEEARHVALDWKGKSKNIPISVSVSIKLRSVPGNLWFGQYEVTQTQWEAIMGENPSRFKGENNPVENVSWDDCQKFMKKLNALPTVKQSGLMFRLATEEEWERACRAGAMGGYCLFADGTEITMNTLGQVAWFVDNSDGKTHHPVGQKQPNAFGLYDMHGNVWEWTSTADGEDRVGRGGSWLSSAEFCGSSFRNRFRPSSGDDNLGFRLCASSRAD